MRVEFVCNLPGPADGPNLDEVLKGGMETACRPRIFVEADPSWRRVGPNFIGTPYGRGDHSGDVGIYVIPSEERRA